MIMGIFRGTYSYGWQKYSAAALITLGLIIFNFGNKSKKAEEAVGLTGLVLLFISLFFDGLVATQSDVEKGKGTKTHAYHLMISNNLVGLIFSIFGIILDYKSVLQEFTMENVGYLFIIGITGTLG